MSMLLNVAGVDALHSATYVEDFLDSVEWLPDDVQRNCSQMREIDAKMQEKFEEINAEVEACYEANVDAGNKKKYLKQIQKSLVSCQEMGDEKLQLVSQILDLIENKSRQLEVDLENLDNGKETENGGIGGNGSGPKSDLHADSNNKTNPHNKRPRRHRNEQAQKEIISSLVAKDDKVKPPKKKKRVKQRVPKDDDSPQFDIPVDPNEPRYCLCNQVSYGEMIGCDNETCVIEWFHFNCVNLNTKPKGKWYCPTCTQERRDKRMR